MFLAMVFITSPAPIHQFGSITPISPFSSYFLSSPLPLPLHLFVYFTFLFFFFFNGKPFCLSYFGPTIYINSTLNLCSSFLIQIELLLFSCIMATIRLSLMASWTFPRYCFNVSLSLSCYSYFSLFISMLVYFSLFRSFFSLSSSHTLFSPCLFESPTTNNTRISLSIIYTYNIIYIYKQIVGITLCPCTAAANYLLTTLVNIAQEAILTSPTTRTD